MGAGEWKLAHEDDRGLESLGSRLLYKLETPGVVDSLIERNLWSHPSTRSGSRVVCAREDKERWTHVVAILDRLAVREGVGERHTEFDHVRAASFHGEHERHGRVDGGESGGQKSDECRGILVRGTRGSASQDLTDSPSGASLSGMATRGATDKQDRGGLWRWVGARNRHRETHELLLCGKSLAEMLRHVSFCRYGYEPKERSVVQSAELMCVGRTGRPDKSDLRPNAVIREILALANQPLP